MAEHAPHWSMVINCADIDRMTEFWSAVLGLELGATHVRDSDDPEDPFVVFADPEGNLFCVCPL